MYKRYYDGYAKVKNETGEIVIPQSINKASCSPDIASELAQSQCGETEISACGRKNSLLNLPCDADDLILIGILIFLLLDKKEGDADDDNNIFLILIIGFVLLSDII